MIPKAFTPPNFKAKVEDSEGRIGFELHYAPDRATLDQSLAERITTGELRRVVRVVRHDFSVWKRRAQRETQRACAAFAAGQNYEFQSTLWTRLKAYLLRVFDGKCAFCEADFRHVAWGDVEHYRPKGAVTDEDGQPVLDNAGNPHPGYYWLAYYEGNLMPSCSLCNQPPSKMNKFPIGGQRAFRPEDSLDAEEDVFLLHPYRDDPRLALEFLPRTGTVQVRADAPLILREKAAKTIKVCRLNRYELQRMRAQSQDAVRNAVKALFVAEQVGPLSQLIERVRSGRDEFSSARFAEVNDLFGAFGLH